MFCELAKKRKKAKPHELEIVLMHLTLQSKANTLFSYLFTISHLIH